MKAKSLILYRQIQIQIPIPNKYLRCGYKGLVFCRSNGWIMKIWTRDSLYQHGCWYFDQKYSKWPRICLSNFKSSMKKGFIGRPYSVAETIHRYCRSTVTNFLSIAKVHKSISRSAMEFKERITRLCKVKYAILFCLILLFFWWGTNAVLRFWSQP